MQLEVSLGDRPVGVLTLTSEGRGIDTISFDFHPSYWELPVRPILGQRFEDERTTPPSRMRAPPWFSNLLPEGPLRELVAKRARVHSEREFFLLDALGNDLPGAVRIRALEPVVAPEADTPPPPSPTEGELRFSLAGVQLKFSMVREGKGLTIPTRGVDGDWIAKLPGERFEAVTENEFSMMSWARASGIATADFDLVSGSMLTNLPPEVGKLRGPVFATKRFDRSPQGRVHQEDFAQVLGVFAHEKYEQANSETVANLFFRIAGPPALDEFIRRLVFVVASGNEDAHLKNWAFLYPLETHGTKATISPAYDFVSTIPYEGLKRGLGLKLGGTRDFRKVSLQHFRRLGERVGSDVVPTVKDAVQRTGEAWKAVRAELPLPDDFKRRLDEHLAAVPLFLGK